MLEVTNSNRDADFVFQTKGTNSGKTNLRGLNEEVGEFHFPYGSAYMHHWNFDGINIIHTKHRFNNHYCFENKNNSNVVSLEFNIRGKYQIHHFGNTYDVTDNQHNIIYSPGTHNTFNNIDLETETFKIEFSPEYFLEIINDSNELLHRFADRMALNQPVVLSPHSGIIDVQLLHVIRDIIQCKYKGGIRKIFLLSKCLEILVLQAESFVYSENPDNRYIRHSDDLEKLEYARRYLIDHVDMPPNLFELAMETGLSEYKLKRGFKEVYQSTVFGYLSEYRLNTAKKQLESLNRSVSEIAYELGYSSPQHFSKAFSIKFGMSPKSVRKIKFS